ncbi:MFS transporter [Phenylobacterium sp.]|uniref:MFS transporter n=1 Tax=Phenylobacterium sp. TaxID=1871053 RepID=UPI002E344E0D|nr:MFS transporter [Phenylobacterium sp.]HEX3363886.1 MFS transporter [Phenylobacterium sp.]
MELVTLRPMATLKRLRWWIVVLVCMGTVLNYLARNSLGVLAPQLTRELGFTTQQYSWVVAAFQVTYTAMQPICGAIIDSLGLKLAFALFAVAWSLANMAHGFAGGWISLAFFRGLLGLSESAAIPAGVKAVSEWFPARDRSVAIGFFNAGTSLGAAIAPPIVIFLSLAYGWRSAFVVTGALGLVWAAAWYLFYDSPARHPALSPQERALAPSIVEASTQPPVTLRSLFAQRSFWGLAIPRFLIEPAWQTFSFWIPLYLARERGMDLKSIALFAWLPFLASDAGGILGGYLSPFLMKRFRMGLLTSRATGFTLGAVMMIAPASVGLAFSPYTAIALFCVGGFAHQMLSVLLNTLTTDVFPRESVARANGLVGMCGWIGGLLFSLLVGALADTVGYAPLFRLLAVFDIAGAMILFAVLRPVRMDARSAFA